MENDLCTLITFSPVPPLFIIRAKFISREVTTVYLDFRRSWYNYSHDLKKT